MSSRSSYALVALMAGSILSACGSSSPGSAGSPSSGPITSDGLPPIRTSPFPTTSVNPNDPSVAQCRADVTTVTNATELFHRNRGFYAPDMASLVAAGLLKAVPKDVHYGYDAPNVDPVVIGTVEGC